MNEQMVPSLDSAAQAWLAWMWPMTWQLCGLMAFLTLLTWLLRNRSARLRYALWLLVPIRLMLPPTLALATGWGWWLLPTDDVAVARVETSESIVIAPQQSAPVYELSLEPSRQVYLPVQDVSPVGQSTRVPRVSETNARAKLASSPEPRERDSATSDTASTWRILLLSGWLLGVMALTMRLLFGSVQAATMVRRSVAPSDGSLVDLVQRCRDRIRLRRTVAVRESTDASVPMQVGLFRPTILLPKGIDQCLTPKELQAVVLHELHHVARHDALVHLVQSVLGIVYFFHPLLWVANRLLIRFREDACDEATVTTLGGQRRDYGAGIVKVAEMATGRRPSLAMGVVESGGPVKRRLRRILNPCLPLGRRLSWTALALLLVVGAVVLPSAARPGGAATPKQADSGGQVADDTKDSLEKKADDADREEDDSTSSGAGTSDVNEEEAAQEHAAVRGVIVDEKGSPRPGVEVYTEWYGDGRAETHTDAGGRFELLIPHKVMRGRLIRAIADSGRLQAQHRLPWADENAPEQPIQLALGPARRVQLHVVDAAGNSLSQAHVGVIGGYSKLATGKTDKAGRVEFLIPQDMRAEYVYALSDDHGLDYRAYVLPRGQSGDKKAEPAELPEGPVKLTLDGVKPLRVRLVEADDTPIAGVSVYPWLLLRPDQPENLNLSSIVDLVRETTDESGWAEFRWIPAWNERLLTIWPHSDEFVRQRGNYDPKTGDGTLTIKLERVVPIGGRVTFSDGSPASGISIKASGAGYQFDDLRGDAITDDDGCYEIKAAPNKVYLVVVNDEKWAALPQTGFAVWPGKPVKDLDFALRPATRLFGRVTVGPDRQPVEGQRISVYQYGQDAHNMKGVVLPNPEKSNRWVQPLVVRSTTSDEGGNFALSVGDGKFDIRGPRQNKVEKFEIANETQREVSFHADRPEKGMLRGSVVTGDPPKPVSGAELVGIYRHGLAGLDMQATTDDSGNFEVERELHRTVIRARTKDGTLAGVVQIKPDDTSVTIPILPMASASGRLIDATSGEALPEQEISYGIRIHLGDDNAAFSHRFGGKCMTDAEGSFGLPNLILGHEYNIDVTIRDALNSQRMSWRTVGKVKADTAEEIDLGDLKLKPTYRSPTLKNRIVSAFGVKDSPVERFASAMRNAALGHQRILIVFAAPDCNATKQFMQLRYEDTDVRRALDSYRIMAVDSSAGKFSLAKQLADSVEADLSGSRSVFAVFVTGADGKQVTSADAATLMYGGKISKDKLLGFARKHALEPLDGRKLLDDAMAQAKAENKRIIVQETATWCGPCWKLSRFLHEHRSQWEGDYVWVKMDHRWKDAAKIMEALRDGAEGGIPWWAVLNSDGEIQMTSNGPDGNNVGFPSSESGLAHFRTALEKTALRMTADEITALVDALKDSDTDR